MLAQGEQLGKALHEGALGDSFSKYFHQIHTKAPHLRKSDVVAYRDYIVKHGPKMTVQDSAKDNSKATQIRLEGNNLYKGKAFGFALDKYHETICWATNDSKDLGMGYANCSAIYYAINEYEFALVCIFLAKKYNYPAQLMPKLLERESCCKEMIENGYSRIQPKSSMFELSVETNPKIPFLADGISMKELPDYGRSMVADREFKAGDVILDEKMITCSVNSGRKYSVCHYCSSPSSGPFIPCLKCVSVTYCKEECREASMKAIHRFECGISEKLDHISDRTSRIGMRMFFHGLNLFDDDVNKMMEFCKAHGRTGANPFTLDYSNYDPLEEFKVFHQTKVPDIDLKTDSTRCHAALYYSILIEHPPVQALLTNEAQQDFMLHCIYDYIRTAWPVISDGHLQFVLLRPIKKNEQILTSYNIMYAEKDMGHLTNLVCGPSKTFKCACVICDPVKKRARSANPDVRLPIRPEHLDELNRKLSGPLKFEDKLNAMRQFMQRYGHLHPDFQGFDRYIRSYRGGLTTAFLFHTANRRRIVAGREVAGDE